MPSTQESTRPRQSKTYFVKSMPADMPAKEVVERAKKQGLVLSDKYVYVVRSNARRKIGKAKRRYKARVVPTTGAPTAGEKEFRRLALALGVKKAEELLSDTKKKIADIIAGK